MDKLEEIISSASLIVTIGARLEAPAQKIVTTYGFADHAASDHCLVFGSSLVHSREDQPGGQVIAQPILPGNFISTPEAKVSGLYDVDQLDLPALRTTVEKMWHDFREHVTRVRSFSKAPEIARDQIVILADAWDPTCSFILIPVLYCFRELAYEADETEVSVIIDTSHFSVENNITNQKALEYRLISEVEYRIDPNPKLIHDPLLEKLGFSDDLELDDIRLFIVNEEKESCLYAKSHQEIEEVVYSFLLGFVDPHLRDSLLQGANSDYQRRNRTFFSSFGSVGMSANPQIAVDCCGLRLSSEIIQKGFLEEQPPDRELVKQLSGAVIRDLGETNQWFQELIKKPDFSVIKMGQSNYSISYDLPKIPYTAPDVDQIHLCSYVNDVDQYHQNALDKLFGEMDFLQRHIQLKTNSILTDRKALIYGVLKQTSLIPGFISNLRFVLNFIKNDLEKRQHEAQDLTESFADPSHIEKQFADAKNRFTNVLQSITAPPAWLKKIPEGGIKKFIRMILKTLQAPKYMELDKARDKVEVSLTRLISLPYEKALIEFNQDVSKQSLLIVDNLDTCLNEFKKNLDQMNSDFLNRLEENMSNLEIEGKDLNFVYNPLTERVCDLLYERFKPEETRLFSDLVSQMQWALRCIEKMADNPSQELYEYSISHFSGIKDISLPRMIEDYAEVKQPGEKFYRRLTNFTDRVLLLLNPEPFAMGENAYSSSRNVALISRGGESFWSDFMGCQTKEWEEHTGISTHIASFITAQHGFSFPAIEHHFAEGKKLWEALSDSEKQQFDIVPSKDKNPPRAEAEQQHDGIWRITYNWSFTPSGSTKAYTFEVSIEVDQTNYKNLASRERHNGQYHLYAEEKSSELDQLMNEFKRIQWQYNWDSFDQASNVLSFVQSFISYRYDKDTKFVEEYPRYPLETLWDRVGDCEDFAILSGAILSRLGFKVALLLYPNPCHLAFGVETSKNHNLDKLIKDPKNNVSYYYGEGTSKGWQLGEIPVDYLGATPDFYRINESSWIVPPE